jgi:hypothetical protein
MFNYGDIITYGWGAHGTASADNRLLIADNDKIRYISGLKRHDHISQHRERLNILKPDDRAKIHSATLIFKQLKNQSPQYLNDLFVPNANRTRASSNKQLRVINKPKTAFDKRAFSYSAITFWNSIPNSITESGSVETFKTKIKQWMSNPAHITQ